jgi:hypothetical protein
MLDRLTPDDLPWLLPLILLSIPLVAGVLWWICNRLIPVKDSVYCSSRRLLWSWIGAGSIFLCGIAMCGSTVYFATLVPKIVASHPDELSRWLRSTAMNAVMSGWICGLGAHFLTAWRRIAAQRARAQDSHV